MAYTKGYLETLDRSQLRKLAQDADLGGTWTASAGKADLVASLLAGARTLRGVRVDRTGAPLDPGAHVPAPDPAERIPGTPSAETEEEAEAEPTPRSVEAPAGAAEAVAQAIAGLVRSLPPTLDADAVRSIVRAEVAKAEGLGGAVHVHLPGPGGEVRKLEGVTHSALPDVVEAVAVTGKALLLGPAGCGKTTIARQVAEALGRPFYFLSCTGGTSEGQLLGRLLLDGSFLGTPLLRAIEEGGVCLLDEADAMDPNVTLALNAGIANGAFSVPNRPADPVARKHADFALILAGNDVTGGSMLYSGRNQQDAALLDRFAGCTFVLAPDPKLERAMAKGYGEAAEWLAPLVRALRANVTKHKLRRVVSQRMIEHAGQLIHANADRWAKDRDGIVARLLAGWASEEVAKALEGVDYASM